MAKARITSKGQITVPKAVRDHLGVHPGDDLLFEVHGSRIEVISRRRQGVGELAGLFPVKRAVEGERVRSWTAETRRLVRRRSR